MALLTFGEKRGLDLTQNSSDMSQFFLACTYHSHSTVAIWRNSAREVVVKSECTRDDEEAFIDKSLSPERTVENISVRAENNDRSERRERVTFPTHATSLSLSIQ